MKWAVQILIVFGLCLIIKSLDDPYKVLGIHKSSSVPEIRKAYKQLAKEWHPDKNDDPAAADKFVEITQAYELLSDPERRRLFDTFGRVEESRPRPEPQFRQYDPFDDIFAGSGFRFRFSDRDITLFHKLSISSRAYENILVPKSYRTPHLLLFYSDWCFPCLQVEPVWRRIMEELEPIGVGIATVHAENEKALARKVGVPSLPCLILLSDGRASVYKESLFSVQKVVEFVRNKMPYKMVPQVNDENVDLFLSGWVDNKVRALVFQRTEPLRLRYLLTAFYHRDRVAFGYVPLGPNSINVRAKYQVSSEQDALLVFNEITERPVAFVSMADIPVHTMHDVINNNNYLLLPRLSSQALLDALCPAGLSWARKRLCVVLVCQDTPNHDLHRQSLRRFALESHYSKERVRFMYIYQERQPQFISALTSGKDSPVEPVLHVAILCRRDNSHVKYEWISGQETWESYNNTKQHLESAIDRVLHTTQALLNEAVIGELIDEHTQGVVSKIITKFLQTIDILQESLGKEHILPAISIVITVALIVGGGYFMNHLIGSHDQTALLWKWKTKENQVECICVCKGHAKSIECIQASPDGTRFASGSWDNMLKIWSTSLDINEEMENGEPAHNKKAKKNNLTKTPLVTLKGHKEAVSGLSWKDDVELATSSWDHTIRIWDTEMSSSIRELAGNKAFFDVDWSPLNHLLITANSDKNIKLYDPRSNEGQICKLTFVSHQDWVMSVKWSKTKDNLFVSSSNDKSVRVWDTRSPLVPMYDLSGHEDKVLACDWSTPELVVSGGADNSLRIYKMN